MKVRVLSIFICLLIALPSVAFALVPDLEKSIEGEAMGGAYTAIVEDDSAIFLNPAGVAGYKDIEVHFLTTDLQVSEDVYKTSQTLRNIKSPSGSAVNSMMGYNIYGEANERFTLMAPGFGLSAFYNAQGGVYAQNQTIPQVQMGEMQTYGVQAAFGWSTKTGGTKGRGRKNHDHVSEWRFGIAAKYLERKGGYSTLNPSSIVGLNSSQISSMFGASGSGYGADVGVQRVQEISAGQTLQFGAAWQDLGNTSFSGAQKQSVKQKINLGVATTFKSGIVSITPAAEVQQINVNDDFKKKTHFGVRIGLPLIDLYAGVSEFYLTYGFAFDIWLLRVSAATYVNELGAYQGQDPERIYALKIDLKISF